MNLKTYRARSIADALAEVKKDLGKDAVILHTRSFKTGGMMGLGAKTVIEITAAPAGQVNRKPSAPARAAGTPPARPAPAPAPEPFLPWTAPRAVTAVAAEPARVSPVTELAPDTNPQIVEFTSTPVRPPARLSTQIALSPSDPRSRLLLEEELGAIKRLVGQVLQCARHAQAHTRQPDSTGGPSNAVLSLGPMSEPLFANYMRLVEGQVSTDLAESLAGAVRQELSGHELSDPATVRSTLLRHLTDRLPVTGEPPRKSRPADGRPFTIALVGPTGVGKTTTIAKLAAVHKLRHNRRVGLVTCDTYRIAAVEQLRTYAGIIGLPLMIVSSAAEAQAACKSLEFCDLVLVDTAGRSQHDSGRIDELRQLLACIKPHEAHLVLSAAAAEPVMLKAAERFGVLKPDRLLFTKLDEAVHFGPVLNAVVKSGLRVGYVTTGQEVPDHIEPAESARLARAVLDGELGS